MQYYILLFIVLIILYYLRNRPDYKRKFTDKSVVIVGASSGIGEQLAKQVSKYKPRLVVVARSKDKLDQLKQQCIEAGAKEVAVVVGDVSSSEGCKEIVEKVVAINRGIDVLFLNAGIGLTSTLYSLETPDVLDKVMQVDFFGSMHSAFYSLPHLRKSNGHIVVTSSVYGKMPGRGVSAYVAAKHALQGFFDCLRVEERRNKIKVTIVCPGYVATSLLNKSLGSDGKEVGKHKKTTALALSEISLHSCVDNILSATASNQTETTFPLFVTTLCWLRSLLGSAIFDKYLL